MTLRVQRGATPTTISSKKRKVVDRMIGLFYNNNYTHLSFDTLCYPTALHASWTPLQPYSQQLIYCFSEIEFLPIPLIYDAMICQTCNTWNNLNILKDLKVEARCFISLWIAVYCALFASNSHHFFKKCGMPGRFSSQISSGLHHNNQY